MIASKYALFSKTGLATLVGHRKEEEEEEEEAPDFLVNCIPPTVEERVHYILWNQNDISFP